MVRCRADFSLVRQNEASGGTGLAHIMVMEALSSIRKSLVFASVAGMISSPSALLGQSAVVGPEAGAVHGAGSIYNPSQVGAGPRQAAEMDPNAPVAAGDEEPAGAGPLGVVPLIIPVLGVLFGGGSDEPQQSDGGQVRVQPGSTSSSSGGGYGTGYQGPIVPRSGQKHWDTEWQIAFMKHINSSCGARFRNFQSTNGDGLAKICGAQTVKTMSLAQKNLVKMALFEGVTLAESGNNPLIRGAVSPRNNGVYPHGLFQLEASSLGGYRRAQPGCCPITNNSKAQASSESSVYNPIGSIKCAVTMVNHNTRDGHYTQGYSARDATGAFKYWQPMQGQDARKQKEIYEKAAGFCRDLMQTNGQEVADVARSIGVDASVVAAAGGDFTSQRNVAATPRAGATEVHEAAR